MSLKLITGYPGYLASTLLPRLLARSPGDTVYHCLVLAPLLSSAERERSLLPSDYQQRVRLVAGDITRADLGVGSKLDQLLGQCSDVLHAAAVYDLAVPKDVAYAVNVDGTRNLLRFAQRASATVRFHHVSTCYVSGDFAGRFYEHDLDVGQGFRNYYEESKFIAEKLVHYYHANGCPTTIYRPSIIAGDSVSGVARKQDGLFFFIHWLLAQPRWLAIMPRIADTGAHRFNAVPSDFVVEAMAYLSHQDAGSGLVYHLSAEDPPTIRELTRLLAEATDRRVVNASLPTRVAKLLLRSMCSLSSDLDIPAEAIDYLAHPADYDTTNTLRDLAASGIAQPAISQYLTKMVAFVRAQKVGDLDV